MKHKQNADTSYCHHCQKEVPTSTAKHPEGKEYAYHFCSQDCMRKWETAQKHPTETK